MIVCERLLNIAVPGPLEQSLFRRSGVLNFNLSCNSLLEEVLAGIVSCQVLFLDQRNQVTRNQRGGSYERRLSDRPAPFVV